jgi:glyoxylase-like metal-dependent hydrolase (beta-lactamase superfamily II)
VTAHLLVDCEGTFATLREAFPQVDSDGDWWVPVQAALVQAADATIVVDTGAGPKPRSFLADREAQLVDQLAAHGVAPDDVDIVVNTHLHIDHVGWNGSFPNARYVVHEDDWSFFTSAASLLERPHLQEKIVTVGQVERVAGETEIAEGVHLQPAPGHTPGHMIVRTGEFAIIGDLLAHELQAADPDFVFANDVDSAQAAETRRRVMGELAAEGARVLSGHLRGVGRFRPAGKGFSWSVE